MLIASPALKTCRFNTRLNYSSPGRFAGIKDIPPSLLCMRTNLRLRDHRFFSNKIPTCIFQLFYITAKDLFFNHIDMFSPCRDVALQLIAKLNNLFWMFACVLHRTCAIVCQEIKCLIYWKTLFDIILNTLGQSLFTCLNFLSLI